MDHHVVLSSFICRRLIEVSYNSCFQVFCVCWVIYRLLRLQQRCPRSGWPAGSNPTFVSLKLYPLTVIWTCPCYTHPCNVQSAMFYSTVHSLCILLVHVVFTRLYILGWSLVESGHRKWTGGHLWSPVRSYINTAMLRGIIPTLISSVINTNLPPILHRFQLVIGDYWSNFC